MKSETEQETESDFNIYCRYCGLSMDEHDDSGCCPAGTEEFGGRR